MKQTSHSDMLKKTSKSACTSTIVVSPDPLPPTPTYLAITPENRRGIWWS